MSDSPTSSNAARNGLVELPLWEAALAWCDQALVQDLRDAHAAFQATRSTPPRLNPFPTGLDKQYSRHVAYIGGPALAASQRRNAAVIVVECDLRQRIAAGQVVLSGLRTEPEVDHLPTILSKHWAEHLAFDWEHGNVAVFGVRYVAVTGRAVEIQTELPAESDALEQLEEVRLPPRRPVGRTSHKLLVEAALETYLVEVGKSREALAAPDTNRSRLAVTLEARLKRLHPDKVAMNGALPKQETIRKHVRDILASALVKKGGR